MKVEKSDVLAFTISEVERLDPVRVVIENISPGKGLLTITCFGRSWNGSWGSMGDDTVQEFVKRVSNDYLIGCFDRQLDSTDDADNDANLQFVKTEILRLRRQDEIYSSEAREMWEKAENADDVKAHCCDYSIGSVLVKLFGDDPWYAKWPTVPNHEYQYLDRIVSAVRDGLAEMERAT